MKNAADAIARRKRVATIAMMRKAREGKYNDCLQDLGEWWARPDSNREPDRYERPALTIELQALPRKAGVLAEEADVTRMIRELRVPVIHLHRRQAAFAMPG